jgi:light-regulated signal transduction histidine kinase (bacteriophytochrome)
MQKIRIDLDAIVHQVVAEQDSAAAGRNIEWSVENLPAVVGDAAMIRIVLVNYISNAVKYSQKREIAKIEIGTVSEEHGVTVFVRDNGAGFDMRYAGKLFGVFHRLHRDDEFEGTGIGLATARRIITRHGGKTWAEAELDKGATFYFSLPAGDPENVTPSRAEVTTLNAS